MISRDVVAPAANHLDVTDEGDILEGRMLLVGFVTMANQTGRDDNLLVLVELQMGIFAGVTLHDVTIIAKIHPTGIGGPPQ